jgi:hypothetical protein
MDFITPTIKPSIDTVKSILGADSSIDEIAFGD